MTGLFLSNLDALATSDEIFQMNCYHIIHNCSWLNCSYVVLCDNCKIVQADEWSMPSTCNE